MNRMPRVLGVSRMGFACGRHWLGRDWRKRYKNRFEKSDFLRKTNVNPCFDTNLAKSPFQIGTQIPGSFHARTHLFARWREAFFLAHLEIWMLFSSFQECPWQTLCFELQASPNPDSKVWQSLSWRWRRMTKPSWCRGRDDLGIHGHIDQIRYQRGIRPISRLARSCQPQIQWHN